MNITDEQVIEDLKRLDDYLVGEFIAQKDSIFTKPPTDEYIRNNYNSIVKHWGERKDGGNWPDMLRLKYKIKENTRGSITDSSGQEVDPTTLYGRKCQKLLFNVSIMYSAGKAYGVTMNMVKMQVSDNTLNVAWDYIEETKVNEITTTEETPTPETDQTVTRKRKDPPTSTQTDSKKR